jgi:3-hydroxyacyl-[acyl-carrier-protein] dehydratase
MRPDYGGIMPPPLLYDLARIDTEKVLYGRDVIYDYLPHRYEFQMLDGICVLDQEAAVCAGYVDCKEDAWWARGHIPGKPIMPGVLQLEAAAQLLAFVAKYVDGIKTFVAFGSVERCRFREAVLPPSRMIVIANVTENRPRRVRGETQGIVDGRIVFHAEVAGLALPGLA